jgi:transcriptional regulator with XRE-family HTH domain
MIAEKRRSKNLTQQQLGDIMGVKRSTVAMWESGASLPRADLLPKLASTLGCTVDELLRPQTEAKETPA